MIKFFTDIIVNCLSYFLRKTTLYKDTKSDINYIRTYAHKNTRDIANLQLQIEPVALAIGETASAAHSAIAGSASRAHSVTYARRYLETYRSIPSNELTRITQGLGSIAREFVGEPNTNEVRRRISSSLVHYAQDAGVHVNVQDHSDERNDGVLDFRLLVRYEPISAFAQLAQAPYSVTGNSSGRITLSDAPPQPTSRTDQTERNIEPGI